MNETLELITRHASRRTFNDKAVDDKTLHTIINAAQHAASSSFIQAYSVIRVIDSEKRAQIAAAAGGQAWVENAPLFLVWCADLTRVERASTERDQGALEGYTEHFLAASVDVALAAQNAMLAAESLGLGGVYIGGIRNNPQLLVDLLTLPKQVYPVFGMCLGYPDREMQVKPRFNTGDILHIDRFDKDTAEIVSRYDNTMEQYYGARSRNNRTSTWSEQTTKAVQGKLRPHMLSFLQDQGFLKK